MAAWRRYEDYMRFATARTLCPNFPSRPPSGYFTVDEDGDVEAEKKHLVDNGEFDQMMMDIAKILKEAKKLIVARVNSLLDVQDLDLHVPIDINQWTQTRCDRNCR